MTDWLTGTLIATSALMALVLVLREPVRRRFGPAVAYALWLIPALRMVLPPLTKTVERIAPAATPASLSLPLTGPAAEAGAVAQVDWSSILLGAWLAGAAIMLVHGLIVYRRQRRLILDAGVQLATLDGIRLVRSERVRGPIAFGLIDRVIILPLDFDQRFSERERSLALDHELAHHRSGDLVANAIAFVLLCLQWFNPLAWAAHAAFRFDQEVACDARVLDKAGAGDRRSYGEAIAKAASGRALLFAGALDRPSTLSRRLKIMTRTNHPAGRTLGYLCVGGALLLGLPLTATWAINYVEVRAPAPTAPPALPALPAHPAALAPALKALTPLVPLKPVAPVVTLAAAAPVGRSSGPQPDISFIGNDTVQINGVTKRWEELTPAERDRIRRETQKARAQLNEQMKRLPQELANAQRELERFRDGSFQREMAEARVNMRDALAELDANAAHIRAAGKDPEKMKAEVRRSLAEVEAMNVDEIARKNQIALNPDKIRGDVENAARSLDEVEAKLNRLDGR